MPLLDLITPWASALSGEDPETAVAQFHDRHDALLDRIVRQRAPHTNHLPLAPLGQTLDVAASRAGDPMLLQRLRDLSRRATTLGADVSTTTLLLAGDGQGEPMVANPGSPALVALFVDGLPDDALLQLAALRGRATITRWQAHDSESVVRGTAHSAHWDLWELARVIPLREWIYTAGIAAHLAHAVLPESEPHQLLELRRGELGRLRERERVLRSLLEADLDQAGLGLVLRWLVRDTPISVRTMGNVVIPPGAGAYLGWRLTAARVTRLGIHDALRSAA